MSEGKRIDFLIEELQDKIGLFGKMLLNFLQKLVILKLLNHLINTLKDDDWHVKEAAALSFAVFADSRAIRSSYSTHGR